MYLFILIILIAEIIIASAIVYLLWNVDNKVLAFCNQVDIIKPKIKQDLNLFKSYVKKASSVANGIKEFMSYQREKIIVYVVQNVLIYMLLFLLKGQKKRYSSAVQLALAIRDCWKNF